MPSTWTEHRRPLRVRRGPPDCFCDRRPPARFGAPGHDLVPLADELARAAGPGAPPTRYVFPEAPLELGGGYGRHARAWWLLDLERIEADLRRGAPRDRGDEVPEGLPAARSRCCGLLDQLEAPASAPPARASCSAASRRARCWRSMWRSTARAPAGLVLMSGTLINAAEWRPLLPSLRGVPVLLSHGRGDPLLPYSAAETLRDLLQRGRRRGRLAPLRRRPRDPARRPRRRGTFLRSLGA